MNKYTSNLFESIKDALNKKAPTESNFKDFMKMETGKTYVVRLLPNVEAPDRTFFHYYHHMWKSIVSNNMISFLCPTTYGEKCPIEEYRSRIYRSKNEAEIDKTRPIKRNESWLANVYVVKDPTNPENEGKVKILRYGKQLSKIITDAISGDESDEFGAKVFDLSENGCSFKIKVEQNEGGYPTYVSSKFMSPSKLEGIDDIDEIYTQVKDLDKIFNHKTYGEIKELLDFHFLGLEKGSQDTQEPLSTNEDENYDSMVEIESNAGIFEKKKVAEQKVLKEELDNFDDADAKIEEILKDL
jgi:hypothetical protein